MVGKWSRTKFNKPGERDHAAYLAEVEKKNQSSEKSEAERRATDAAFHSQLGIYRNLNGDSYKIVESTRGGHIRSEVPKEEDTLPCGYAWLPAEPRGQVGAYDPFYEFAPSRFEYRHVVPVDVGFNQILDVGADGPAKVYQARDIMVLEGNKGKFYHKVETSCFDWEREFFTVLPDGDTMLHPPLGSDLAPASAPVLQEQYGNLLGDLTDPTNEQSWVTPLPAPEMTQADYELLLAGNEMSSLTPQEQFDIEFAGFRGPANEEPQAGPLLEDWATQDLFPNVDFSLADDMSAAGPNLPPPEQFTGDMSGNAFGQAPLDHSAVYMPHVGYDPLAFEPVADHTPPSELGSLPYDPAANDWPNERYTPMDTSSGTDMSRVSSGQFTFDVYAGWTPVQQWTAN
jgi:hypothetical protein